MYNAEHTLLLARLGPEAPFGKVVVLSALSAAVPSSSFREFYFTKCFVFPLIYETTVEAYSLFLGVGGEGGPSVIRSEVTFSDILQSFVQLTTTFDSWSLTISFYPPPPLKLIDPQGIRRLYELIRIRGLGFGGFGIPT